MGWTLRVVAMLAALWGLAGAARAEVRPAFEWGLHHSGVAYDRDLGDLFGIRWRNGWRPSFTAGASVGFPLGRRWALAPGVRYVQKGNRIRYSTGLAEGDVRQVLNYLAMPVILEVRPFTSRSIALTVGPEVAFLLSAYTVGEDGGDGMFRDEQGSIEDLDVSVEGGVEYAFRLENHEGFMRVRYSHGVVAVAEPPQWITAWSTRGLRWTMGIRW
jgi:hypothetical protein